MGELGTSGDESFENVFAVVLYPSHQAVLQFRHTQIVTRQLCLLVWCVFVCVNDVRGYACA